jgi:hypothetical protein
MTFPRWTVLALACVVVTGGLCGCSSLDKKKHKPKPEDMADQNGDMNFESFLGRLRRAVARRDIRMLSSMMTPNFGFSWQADGEGPGVFDYWDRNNLWPEVNLVLKEKFVPSGNFMVAPKEVTFDSNYRGYRAGLQQVNGSWRFAYFVPAPPDQP